MSVVESIFGVFTDVTEWITGSMETITGMFWKAETGLTLIGTLAVCGLAISVGFLLIGLVRKFLRFG